MDEGFVEGRPAETPEDALARTEPAEDCAVGDDALELDADDVEARSPRKGRGSELRRTAVARGGELAQTAAARGEELRRTAAARGGELAQTAAAATAVRWRHLSGSARRITGVSRWLEWLATSTTGGLTSSKRSRPRTRARA